MFQVMKAVKQMNDAAFIKRPVGILPFIARNDATSWAVDIAASHAARLMVPMIDGLSFVTNNGSSVYYFVEEV
jgi:hypothetical protein